MNYMDLLLQSSRETIIKSLSTELCEKDKKAIFKTAVEIVNLETSYQCNRKCDYCPVSNSTRQIEQSNMELSLVRKIAIQLSEIRYENRIVLNLYNEPLLDKKLEEKVRILREYLPWATFSLNSNGDKLNINRIKELSNAGLDYICVTLHPQPFKIDSKLVLNRRITKLIEKNTDDKEFKFNLNDEYLNNGYIEFYTYGIKLRIQWPNWRLLGTDRGGQVDNYSAGQIQRVLPCVKPFREFTIFYNGEVQPCCESFYDKDTHLVKIANLHDVTIFDAYTSYNLTYFRRSVFDFSKKEGICKYCTSADYSNKDKDASLREQILEGVNNNKSN